MGKGRDKRTFRAVARRPWWAAAMPLAIGLACLGGATVVLGRAGGGEGFGGGGGGDGGGGGGGGGIGWLIYFWIRFCIEYPYVGLPVTGVVLLVLYKSHQGGLAAYQGSVIRRGADAADDNRVGEAAAAMMRADPGFSIDRFAQRARLAFMKIQQSWCGQDLGAVRPFVSDGVYERFSLQIEEQKALGYRDQMEQVAVGAVSLVEFTEGNVFDVATVRIEAQAADYRVSLHDGRRISGPGAVEPFVEFWSWVRRHGFKGDSSKPGLIEGNCPNCGAAVEINQSAKCKNCQAILRSGEFDWVLTEITQQSEWRRGRHGLAPGTADYQQKDPGFNRADVEDSASVMFWRKAMSDRVGKIDPLRKMATEEFCAAYAGGLRPEADGSRAYFGDCAVGGAHLLGVVPGAAQDSAVVEIAWEGERMIAHAGQTPQKTGQRIQTHSLYILTRKAGLTSDPGYSISSAHCPNCGAAITSDTSPGCSFCGTVLNDGTRGWVLSTITSAASDLGRQWTAGIATAAEGTVAHQKTISRVGVLAWTVKMVAADGTVDASEREILRSLAAKCHVEPIRLDQMIEMALAGRLGIPDPPDKETALVWLTTMAATAMAEGRLRPQEAKILSRAAQRFGFTNSDVNRLLRQQYAVRLGRARAELRVARQRQGVER
ncbi:MAG: TIM44-like domain-containing protein [Tepidisphaeraceae bacterium]